MNKQEPSQVKNTLIAIILSVATLLAWDHFVVPEQVALPESAVKTQQADIQNPANNVQQEMPIGIEPEAQFASVGDSLGDQTMRHPIETPELLGTINLQTGRFDDLILKNHFNTVNNKEEVVRVLAPSNTEKGFFAEFGYNVNQQPFANQVAWRVTSQGNLTPQNPLILEKSDKTLTMIRSISVDEDFMFTVKDTIKNMSEGAVIVTPYALLKKNHPDYLNPSSASVVHTGFIGWIDGRLEEIKFTNLKGEEPQSFQSPAGGWIGLTEAYWMATLIPDASMPIKASVRYHPYQGQDAYQADYVSQMQNIAVGAEISLTNRFFAGAKSLGAIEAYQAAGIAGFDYTLDWGWFWFFTQPIFKGLLFLYDFSGNYGISILLLTLVLKTLFFPLANKSYTAMSQMKKLQPEMENIRTKHKDDPMKQQQELVALYKREKVNPVAGCWPLLLQIPVFYALYKVLNVALELRHAPFLGWIQDLSAVDPSSIFNLFGLLPYDPALYIPSMLSFLNIGILPILMGITMFMQQRLNPAPTDPVQAKAMGFFPLIFTFVLAHFAAGLVLYWTWNNILSILQQYVIMKRLGVPVSFRLFEKKDTQEIIMPANRNKK